MSTYLQKQNNNHYKHFLPADVVAIVGEEKFTLCVVIIVEITVVGFDIVVFVISVVVAVVDVVTLVVVVAVVVVVTVVVVVAVVGLV